MRVFASIRRNDKYAVVQERKQAKKAARQAQAIKAKEAATAGVGASASSLANPFAVRLPSVPQDFSGVINMDHSSY